MSVCPHCGQRTVIADGKFVCWECGMFIERCRCPALVGETRIEQFMEA